MKRSLLFFLVLLFFTPAVFADDEADIAKLFNIYLINPERRASGDRVSIKGDTATIYYWESAAKRKPDEVICDAFEYLLLGRTTYGRGARVAFDKYPAIQKFELSLYDLETSTRRGEKIGEIVPTQRVFEYLRIGVLRSSLMGKSFHAEDVKKMIEDKRCPEVGKSFIDSVSIKQDYFKEQK